MVVSPPFCASAQDPPSTFWIFGCMREGQGGSWLRALVMSGVSTAARALQMALTDWTTRSAFSGKSPCGRWHSEGQATLMALRAIDWREQAVSRGPWPQEQQMESMLYFQTSSIASHEIHMSRFPVPSAILPVVCVPPVRKGKYPTCPQSFSSHTIT